MSSSSSSIPPICLYIPRFLSFLFLSAAFLCFLISAPSYSWLSLETTPSCPPPCDNIPMISWGVFGLCEGEDFNSLMNSTIVGNNDSDMDNHCQSLTDRELDQMESDNCKGNQQKHTGNDTNTMESRTPSTLYSYMVNIIQSYPFRSLSSPRSSSSFPSSSPSSSPLSLSLSSLSPLSPPPSLLLLLPYGQSSSCTSLFSEWKATQAFHVIAVLSSFLSSLLLLLQSIISIRGISSRMQRCCSRNAVTVGGLISWFALLCTMITAVSCTLTCALSHDILDDIIDNIHHSTDYVLTATFQWPWFSTVAGTTFAWVGMLFAAIFNSAKKLKAQLSLPLDPELEAYEDAAYIRVGNETAQVERQNMFNQYTQQL